jgi:tetratricopeptide (TPR) repeat protein
MLASHGVAPHTRASIRCLRLFGLMRMRMPSTVTAELSIIGDLNGPEWNFENYPTFYSNRTGSFASFELRLLRAIGLSSSGAQNLSYNHVMDPLYEMLGQLATKTFFYDESDAAALTCIRLSADLGVAAPAGTDRAAFQRRCVIMAILRQHFIRGELISCVRLVKTELQSAPADMPLRWWLVRLSISMGDLQSARQHVAEAIAADPSPSASTSFDALLHSGHVAMSCAQYPAAQDFFDRAVRLKPGNSAAAVNLSISHVCPIPFFSLFSTQASCTALLQKTGPRDFQPRRSHTVHRLCQRLVAPSMFSTSSFFREFGGDFLDSAVVANLAGL